MTRNLRRPLFDYYRKNLGSLVLQGFRGFFSKWRKFVQHQSNHCAAAVSANILTVQRSACLSKKQPLKSFDFRGCGPRWETRTPGILLPNLCLNLQAGLLSPLWCFPALLRFLFGTLLPCSFQAPLSAFGICVGLNSVY